MADTTKSWMTDEELARLNEPFPDSAYKELRHGAKLTTLKAAYVTEGLHYVFGQGNVRFNKAVENWGDGLLYLTGSIEVLGNSAEDLRRRIPFAGVTSIANSKSIEDDVKGAFTDIIKKALNENLWMAGPLFKGLIKVTSSGTKMLDEDRSATTDAGTPTGFDHAAVAVKLAKADLTKFYKDKGAPATDALVAAWAASRDVDPVPSLKDLTDEDKVSLAAFLKANKEEF
jgi:hypothetical protein